MIELVKTLVRNSMIYYNCFLFYAGKAVYDYGDLPDL